MKRACLAAAVGRSFPGRGKIVLLDLQAPRRRRGTTAAEMFRSIQARGPSRC
jgi:hypothetical protein